MAANTRPSGNALTIAQQYVKWNANQAGSTSLAGFRANVEVRRLHGCVMIAWARMDDDVAQVGDYVFVARDTVIYGAKVSRTQSHVRTHTHTKIYPHIIHIRVYDYPSCEWVGAWVFTHHDCMRIEVGE